MTPTSFAEVKSVKDKRDIRERALNQLRHAREETEILEAVMRQLWEVVVTGEAYSPRYTLTKQELGQYLQRQEAGSLCSEDWSEALPLTCEFLRNCLAGDNNWEWGWREKQGGDGTNADVRLVLIERRNEDTALHWDAVERVHSAWIRWLGDRTAADLRESGYRTSMGHPLLVLAIAWLLENYKPEVEPDRADSGILAAPVSRSVVEESIELPALLLGLYAGPTPATVPRHGRVSVFERLLVELILGVPQKERKRQVEARGCGAKGFVMCNLTYPVKEIVTVWLQWNARNYRAGRGSSGKLLRAEVERLSCASIPLGKNGVLYPCRQRYATGWGLRDEVTFAVTLPHGSHVGPLLDRRLLRHFGKKDGPAWRALLALFCQWDRQGARNGILIRPKRPVVERDDQGRILDNEGKIVKDKGRPITNAFDVRAVRTGEWELNPYRTRYTPYDFDGLSQLCYPYLRRRLPRLTSNKARAVKREYRERAKKAVRRIEKEKGCYVEEVVQAGRTLWRVMPPVTSGQQARG